MVILPTYPGSDPRLQQPHRREHLPAQLHLPPRLPLGRALTGAAVADAQALLGRHHEGVARAQQGGVLGHELLEGAHVRLGNVLQLEADAPLLGDELRLEV